MMLCFFFFLFDKSNRMNSLKSVASWEATFCFFIEDTCSVHIKIHSEAWSETMVPEKKAFFSTIK